jgi:hypothetical protein
MEQPPWLEVLRDTLLYPRGPGNLKDFAAPPATRFLKQRLAWLGDLSIVAHPSTGRRDFTK